MKRVRSTKGLDLYRPYPKQAKFHDAGAVYRERCFLAGNQLGKTLAGGCETAMHLTGVYPDWWQGKRWDRPVVGWAAGITGESTRDNPQRILMGRPEEWGTGTIPADAITDTKRALGGVTGLLDNIRIRHASGGDSVLYFKFYEKGRKKWQGETIDFVWFDEEPPAEIYSEGLTRTQATGGITYLTATPLLGMTEVVGYFYPDPTTGQRHLTQMTIDDAGHYTAEQRQQIVDGYREHEREARAQGIPMLGSGRIYPIAEAAIKVAAFDVPEHWARIGAMDFGWDPFSAVELVHDRDSDTIYVTKTYRSREETPVLHAAALKAWGDWIPWAWPQDARRQTLEGAGKPLANQYMIQGLNMLPAHAAFEDGSVSVEAGLIDLLDRMQTGRFKVFDHLEDWFVEFRAYHRKEGLVVKANDHLLDATRYGAMMLRFADTKPRPRKTEPRAYGTASSWMG